MVESGRIQRRLILYSVGLTLLVTLSFAWLSPQSLRSSFADRQQDYHTSLFRIANEHLNDYLFALDGKFSTVLRQATVEQWLGRPLDRTDFPRIKAGLAAIGTLLSQQFWPQSKVEEVLLLGTNGIAFSFRLDSVQRYLGEDFDLMSLLEHRPDLAALAPGATALLHHRVGDGLELTDSTLDQLLFLKRRTESDGSAGGFLVAALSPTFLPALFEGLSEESRLSVSDADGWVVWTNGPVPARGSTEGDLVRSEFPLGPQSLTLNIQTDLTRAAGGAAGLDAVTGAFALASWALSALLSLALAGPTLSPLMELSRRLTGYQAGGDPETATLPLPSHGILSRLLWYFGLTVVLPASLFIAGASWHSYRATDQAVTRYVAATIRQAESFIGYNFNLYNDLTAQFIYNDQFQEAWPQGAFVDRFFADLKSSRGEFFAINLYDGDGKPLHRGLEIEASSLGELLGSRATAVDQSIGELVLAGAVKNHYKKTLLVFVRKVRGLRFPSRPDLGYAVFFVDPYPLSQVYGILGTNLAQYLFVVDQSGQVLAGYGSPPFPREGSNPLVVDQGSAEWDYRIVGVIPLAEIRLLVLPVLITGAAVVAVHMVVILVLSVLFASGILRPVRRLLISMETDASVPRDRLPRWLAGRSELAEIATRFNDLVVENYRTRLLEREAQLNALQQQINPHFMYNTLEAIKWMAYRHQALEISDMASAMGSFLRGNMALGDNFTSLADEIEHLKSYLYIQQIRYGDRFEVRWDVEEALLQARVVRLILQPVVENAINHGFDEIRHQGVLTIRAKRTASGLELKIEDNGRGMNEDELERVRAGLVSEKPGAVSIGLSNVAQRLKLCFGKDAGLSLESSQGQGTVVTMTLP